MISLEKNTPGRMCNHVLKSIICFFIAKKYNIPTLINTSKYIKEFESLGLNFHKFVKILDNSENYTTKPIDEKFVIEALNDNFIIDNKFNYMLATTNYCQKPETILNIVNYFNNTNNDICKEIISNNKYKERYNNNDDIFIHIRSINNECSSVPNFPEYKYYENIIEKIKNNNGNIYISTDNLNNNFVTKLCDKYKKISILKLSSIDTVLFGSTCKNIIISSGSFSFTIALFGFYSNIYYNKDAGIGWHPDFYSCLKYKNNSFDYN